MKHPIWIAWCIVLALAIAVRAPAIGVETIDCDELFTLSVVSAGWYKAIYLVAADVVHPPLHSALLKLVPYGNTLSGMRVISIIAGVLTIAAIGLFAVRRPSMKYSTLAAGALIAGSYYHAALSGWGRSYALFGCLTVLAVAGAFLNESWRHGWRRFAHAAVLVALVYTHFVGWLYIISVSLASLFIWADRERRRFWLEQAVIAAVAFVPWLIIFCIFFSRQGGLDNNLGWLSKPDFAAVMDAVSKMGWPALWVAGVWGVIRAWKNQESRDLSATFALCVLVPPLVLFGISSASSNLSLFHPRYFSASIPFLALLAGAGLFPSRSWLVRGGFIFVVLAMSAFTVREMPVPQRPDFSAMARELNARCPNIPVLYANEFSLARPLQYHGVSRKRLGVLGSGSLKSGPVLVVWKPGRNREQTQMEKFLNLTGGREAASIDFPSPIEPEAFVRIALVEPATEADGARSSRNIGSCLPAR